MGMQFGWNSTIPKCIICFLIPLSFIFGFSMDVIALILFFGLHHAMSVTFGHKHTFDIKSSSALFLLILSTYLFSCRSDIFNIEVPLFFAAMLFSRGFFLSRQLTQKRSQVQWCPCWIPLDFRRDHLPCFEHIKVHPLGSFHSIPHYLLGSFTTLSRKPIPKGMTVKSWRHSPERNALKSCLHARIVRHIMTKSPFHPLPRTSS